jgi:dynein heavy chain
VDGKV